MNIGDVFIQPEVKIKKQLKQKIAEDSGKYHSIRNGKIISVDKALSTVDTDSEE